MKLPEKSPAQQLLAQYCDAYNRRDLNTILDFFVADAHVWGTGLDEYRIGLKEIEAQHQRDWAQSDQGVIQIISHVPAPSDANWCAAVGKAIITIGGQAHEFEHLRVSVIIKKDNGKWKMAYVHTSFPDYRNAQGGSFPQTA